MGLPTDEKNPGRRQIQDYAVGGGLDSNVSGTAPRPVKFRLLKNCLIDKRIGAVLKRPGSTTETIASSLGVPLGMGEYLEGSSGSMPINRTLLASFAGTFYQNQANVWSAVAKDSTVSFSTSRQCQFAKIGNNMLIAGGLPAKWGGPGRTITRLGIVESSQAPRITSVAVAGGISLATGTQYMTTHYDSATGLESDWSPLSEPSGPITGKQIQITIPEAIANNWDTVRIYRTLDGGTAPYFVGTVAAHFVATGDYTYVDNKTDAELEQPADDRFTHTRAPDSVFICAKYAQCYWMVDGANPYKLVFSKPYTGSDNDLEYFPVDNYVMANEPITGLLLTPGKLLVFHPRSISYVSGYSVDDFVFQPFIPGVGTVFPNSIATNGSDITFLAEQGFVRLPGGGGVPEHISREIDGDLQPLLAASYNAALYVSACWNTSLRQFIYTINAQSTAGAPWEEVGTGSTASAVAGWQTVPGLVDDLWEDVNNANTSYSMKVRMWGWSPELSSAQEHSWMEYTFPTITNDNVDGAYPTFVFHPTPSADTSDPQQDKTFMGYWSGTEGKIRTCFRRDKNQDDSTNITAELITDVLVPGIISGGYKMFQSLGFYDAYSDPSSDGAGTLKYLIDFEDPELRSYTGQLITISGSVDEKKFPTTLGRYIHLYLTDTSQSQVKILLNKFFIHYRERFRRSGR